MLIKNGKVFLNGRFECTDVRVKNGIFAEFGKLEKANDEEVYDASNEYILPGLVDIHSHGRVGEDFNFADKDGLQKMCDSYAKCGVTAVLGTTMTNEPGAIKQAMTYIGEYRKEKHTGAKLLGINMEGPFLGRDKKGAHDERYLRPIDPEWFEEMRKCSDDSIRIVSVDPRDPKTAEFIKECLKENIRVSVAHTGCDYETAVYAFENGADHVTHLFNAMNPLLHRAPGIVGAAFDKNIYAEIICDGIHVNETLIRMMFKLLPDKMIIISDSMQAAGLSDGMYSLGGLDVCVKNKKATLSDGTIAGSTADVYSEMLNVVKFGIPKETAVLAATKIPAESVGLGDKVGTIEVGRQADFVIAGEELELKKVYIDGVII